MDVAIRRGPLRESKSIARPLSRLPLILVASNIYLQRHGIPKKPEDLAQHKCVSVRFPSSGKRAYWSFTHRLSKAQHIHYPSQGLLLSEHPADTLVDAALLGCGITAIAACFALPWLHSGDLKIVFSDYQIEKDSEIFIQYLHREYLPLKVRTFSDFLIENLRQDERLTCKPETLVNFSV